MYLPKPESVLDESQTFDTLYPVNIRFMRVWLIKEENNTLIYTIMTEGNSKSTGKLSVSCFATFDCNNCNSIGQKK